MKNIRSKLNNFYFNQMYFPSIPGLFINPFYFARKGLAIHLKDLAPYVTGKTLDIGCGAKPYEKLCKSSEYIGLELDSEKNIAKKSADCFYNGVNIPFNDTEFDSVMISQVLEHIFNPDRFLGEVNRVLNEKGILLVTVPFVWDEHEQPGDFARYSSFGIRNLLKRNGFEILKQRKSMDNIRVIFQIINIYLYKKTITGNPFVNLAATILFMAPFNLLGEIAGKITSTNPDLYLDNIVLARKVSSIKI